VLDFVLMWYAHLFTHAVGHNVRVAVKTPLGVAVRGVVAGKVPYYESLVTRSGKEHVRATIMSDQCPHMTTVETVLFEGGREGGDPARVALKGATEHELFRHVCAECQ